MKDYFYNVNGTEFHDIVAFGKAWKEAKALAAVEHCPITRTIVDDCGNISYDFYAKGGVFLTDRFYSRDTVCIL